MSIRTNHQPVRSNQLSLHQVLSVGMPQRAATSNPDDTPIPKRTRLAYGNEDDLMDVEEFKMLLTDLPKGLQERILLVSLSDLDGRGACGRVEQICNDPNNKLLVKLCQSETFFLQLCEQLNWIGPFPKWSDFQSAAFPTDPTIPSRVFALRVGRTFLSDYMDMIEMMDVVAVDSIVPSRNPSTWFRFMCAQEAEFGPYAKLLRMYPTETEYYEMLSTYAGKQYPREWICNFTSIAQSSGFLKYVAQENDIARMTQLLSIPNMQSAPQYGSKPLSVALNNGFYDMAKVLLRDPNTDPNFVLHFDGLPDTVPLLYAIGRGLDDIFDMLVAHPKIDVNDIGLNIYHTPLGFCIAQTHIRMARKLVEHPGIDVNAVSYHGSSPINMAIQLPNPTAGLFLNLLLKHPNIDVNALARVHDLRSDFTPLQLAVQLDDPETVKTLVNDPRLDINKLLNERMTALDVANERGRKEIARILKAAGGKSSRSLKVQNCTISANGNMFA